MLDKILKKATSKIEVGATLLAFGIGFGIKVFIVPKVQAISANEVGSLMALTILAILKMTKKKKNQGKMPKLGGIVSLKNRLLSLLLLIAITFSVVNVSFAEGQGRSAKPKTVSEEMKENELYKKDPEANSWIEKNKKALDAKHNNFVSEKEFYRQSKGEYLKYFTLYTEVIGATKTRVRAGKTSPELDAIDILIELEKENFTNRTRTRTSTSTEALLNFGLDSPDRELHDLRREFRNFKHIGVLKQDLLKLSQGLSKAKLNELYMKLTASELTLLVGPQVALQIYLDAMQETLNNIQNIKNSIAKLKYPKEQPVDRRKKYANEMSVLRKRLEAKRQKDCVQEEAKLQNAENKLSNLEEIAIDVLCIAYKQPELAETIKFIAISAVKNSGFQSGYIESNLPPSEYEKKMETLAASIGYNKKGSRFTTEELRMQRYANIIGKPVEEYKRSTEQWNRSVESSKESTIYRNKSIEKSRGGLRRAGK